MSLTGVIRVEENTNGNGLADCMMVNGATRLGKKPGKEMGGKIRRVDQNFREKENLLSRTAGLAPSLREGGKLKEKRKESQQRITDIVMGTRPTEGETGKGCSDNAQWGGRNGLSQRKRIKGKATGGRHCIPRVTNGGGQVLVPGEGTIGVLPVRLSKK